MKRQPRVGTVRVDGAGRPWRKARRIGDWYAAVVEAHGILRIASFRGVTEADYSEAMTVLGYERA